MLFVSVDSITQNLRVVVAWMSSALCASCIVLFATMPLCLTVT